MKKFKVGKKYWDSSACDHNCIFVYEVISRTEKTVVVQEKYDKKQRRCKIYHGSNDTEYIMPEKYSMAPVFYADKIFPEFKNNPEKQGQLASKKYLFGSGDRYSVAAYHTLYNAVEFRVYDAELAKKEVVSLSGIPAPVLVFSHSSLAYAIDQYGSFGSACAFFSEGE